MAKKFRDNVRFHYNSVSASDSLKEDVESDCVRLRRTDPLLFEKKACPEALRKYNREAFLIALAGPLVTLILGLLGFFIFSRYKNQVNVFGLGLSLFLLRFPFNLISTRWKESNYYNSDEFRMAEALSIEPLIVFLPGLIISLFILGWEIFYMVRKRKLDLLGWVGLIVVIGYVLWNYVLGKILIP